MGSQSQEHCTVAHLAEVFQKAQEEIITEWRLQAARLLEDLHLDKPTITDHLPDIIAEIIRDLALGREGALSAEHTRGSPPVHGIQRVYDGLDVGEVVAEYNLLRIAFHTVAEAHGLHIVGDALRVINHRIDEAVRMAVTAFAAHQALLRKERDTEHLAFIAHDLRTPVNAISLLVEELEQLQPMQQQPNAAGLPPPQETQELFEILHRNLSRLYQLIQRVMEASVQSTGTSFKPELRTFELWPLIQRLIRDLSPLSSKSAITVVNRVPPALTVHADAGLLSQVFQNLLGNAFKYAARGRVTVSAISAAGTVTCVVQDNGTGIPLELLSNVFDKLTTDPDSEGTGLGLAIVKQIVEAHGGTVSAESTHGAGATFTFTLPPVPPVPVPGPGAAPPRA